MRVLIACEFSGIVRRAFAAQGHFAVSCDLLPGEGLQGEVGDYASIRQWGVHHQGNVIDLVMGDSMMFMENGGFDLMIAHPPCTHLAVSGARWFKDKLTEQAEALDFVRALMDAPIPCIAIENPISIISSRIRKPDQIIQPWQFGHGETKATCLWLKNLPKLTPTNIVDGREARVHKMAPSPDRWKERSRTFLGIAEAMANQWGVLK
jgi:hypothetical protein